MGGGSGTEDQRLDTAKGALSVEVPAWILMTILSLWAVLFCRRLANAMAAAKELEMPNDPSVHWAAWVRITYPRTRKCTGWIGKECFATRGEAKRRLDQFCRDEDDDEVARVISTLILPLGERPDVAEKKPRKGGMA